MRGTGSPFRPADGPTTPREKQTIDTRTAAPSTVQPSSLHASKMRPPSTIGFQTSRFTPPRMLLVLTSPARCSRPAAILISEERTVGKEGVLTSRSRRSPEHEKKHKQ